MRDKKQLSIINYQLSITNFFLILSSLFGLGLYSNAAISGTAEPNPLTILSPNTQGTEVEVIQIQLKALGYYNGLIDGKYGSSTQNAVTRFQQAQGLKRADGIADWATRKHLQEILAGKINCNTATVTEQKNIQKQPPQGNDLWWKLVSFGVLGSLSAFFYIAQKLGDNKLALPPGTSAQKFLNPSAEQSPKFFLNPAPELSSPASTEILPVEETSLVPSLNLFEKFMADLHSADITQQKKAIWNIAQQGDSRAVQPLVDLMIDANSQQQSLILSALAEIGTRTLKPMNRALAISMQEENPQVRKNAIRDLVRIYDTMAQMSKIILHALADPDPEVQETAKYALNQMNRIRSIPDQQILTDQNTADQNTEENHR